MSTNSKGTASILIIIVCLVIVAVAGYFILFQKGPSPTPSPQSTTKTVKIFLVALEGEYVQGSTFGCNDQLAFINREVEPTNGVLFATLKELLTIESQFVEEGGKSLYNVFSQSNLNVENIMIEAGKAQIYLQGEIALGGICDEPRFEEQLRATALQFPEVKEIEIFINNKPLDEILNPKG
ncbi:GerMN domain-containing protein [Candidatus Woesebacteria bacterium]|nr:GerMN domain-containing protein [Candidatus Woesebacteria bacterium]